MNWGDLTPPVWATTDELKCFYIGMFIGATVRIVRAGLKWVKRIGDDHDRSE